MRINALWAFAVVVAWLAGCAARVQDVRPFAGATEALDAAVAAAYEGTFDAVARAERLTAEVADAGADEDDRWHRLEGLSGSTRRYLAALRGARAAALESMRDHAASLVAAADRGRARIERADATRASLVGFVAAAGALGPPGAGVVGEAVGAFIAAAGEASAALAAHGANADLRRRVEAHAHAVARLADLLDRDLLVLDGQLVLLGDAIESALLERDGAGLAALEGSVRGWRNAEGAGLAAAMGGPDTPGRGERLRAYAHADEALARVSRRRQALDAEVDARRREIGLALAVVRAGRRTVTAWRRAHDDVRAALAQRTTVSLDGLTLALGELRRRLDRLERLSDQWRVPP
ncbi:MAG: hypothetical protein FJ255_01400 [Phycisphaerae bacterium]|nr:hypothetical protein [Phycisphaerae bacterium]